MTEGRTTDCFQILDSTCTVLSIFALACTRVLLANRIVAMLQISVQFLFNLLVNYIKDCSYPTASFLKSELWRLLFLVLPVAA